MKISVNILGTSKNIDRLKVLTACAIRSNQHEVTMNFMAEGSRPDFLPKEWNWINAEKYRISDRHVHALIDGVANESFDYNVFCDDDVIIDIDRFVQMASSEEQTPCVWTTWPGERCTPDRSAIVRKYASKYLAGKNVSDMFTGFCTSVINKKLCASVRKDHDLMQALLQISQDISKYSFIPDLQISILGFLAGAKHINGNVNMGICWPDFANSSVLLKGGYRWHIHATGESPLVPPDRLISALKMCPFESLEELVANLFHPISNCVKAKDFVDKPFDVLWFWRPWRGRIGYLDLQDKVHENICMKSDGTMTGALSNGQWEACAKGFVIKSGRWTWTCTSIFDDKYPVFAATDGVHKALYMMKLKGQQ
jgi:hypothetical protein